MDAVQMNGWCLFAHPLLLNQVERLQEQVELLRAKYPQNYRKKNATKRLAAIAKLILESIPQDPSRPEYRQGNTLGGDRKHWFRAKFYQHYRLFFRYHSESKIILYAWVNDTSTKRAYGSKTDAYRVFGEMLASGCPPDDWDALVSEARSTSDRMKKLIE